MRKGTAQELVEVRPVGRYHVLIQTGETNVLCPTFQEAEVIRDQLIAILASGKVRPQPKPRINRKEKLE